MKNLIYPLFALVIVGCTSMHKFEAAPQSYRLKGAENTINITGKFDVKRTVNALSSDYDMNVKINIDGDMYIVGKLDQHLSGEFAGRDYQGKKTSASCTGKAVSNDAIEVRCIVFIDNERTVTLTF